MKTLSLLLIAVFTFIYSQAQILNSVDLQDNYNYYSTRYPFFAQGKWSLSTLNPKATDPMLKTRKVYSIKYKKGEKTKDTTYTKISDFNNGHLTRYTNRRNGKLRYSYLFDYNTDGYYTQYIKSKKGKTFITENMVYNDSNKIVDYSYYKKGKPKVKRTFLYNESNRKLQADIYYKGHQTPDNTWKYEYWPDNKLKKSEYYKKGKLQYQYLYTCDDEGKKVANDKVKTSLVCFITENNNDGSYIKVFRNTDNKGKVTKTKYTYTKDSLQTMYERVNHKDIIVQKYTYAYDSNRNRIKYDYYKRGGEKIRTSYEYKYDDQRNIIEEKRYNSKGKLTSRIQRSYNADNHIISYVSYKANGKINKKSVYTYDSDGNILKSVKYKGNQAISEVNYEYTF